MPLQTRPIQRRRNFRFELSTFLTHLYDCCWIALEIAADLVGRDACYNEGESHPIQFGNSSDLLDDTFYALNKQFVSYHQHKFTLFKTMIHLTFTTDCRIMLRFWMYIEILVRLYGRSFNNSRLVGGHRSVIGGPALKALCTYEFGSKMLCCRPYWL